MGDTEIKTLIGTKDLKQYCLQESKNIEEKYSVNVLVEKCDDIIKTTTALKSAIINNGHKFFKQNKLPKLGVLMITTSLFKPVIAALNPFHLFTKKLAEPNSVPQLDSYGTTVMFVDHYAKVAKGRYLLGFWRVDIVGFGGLLGSGGGGFWMWSGWR